MLLMVVWAVPLEPPAAAQPDPKLIRVAVARDDAQVTLQIYGRFTMVSPASGAAVHEGVRLREVPVRGVSEGLALGDEILPVASVRVEPARDSAIKLNGRRLRGTLEIVRQDDLTLLVVNHVDLEDYLRGVLSKEAPDYWPEEALKAIAIAARTYALYQRLSKEPRAYDVTGDVMSQDYGGQSTEKRATTRAVRSTTGLILMHRGTLFPTFYHSTCGGMTEHARVMGDYDLKPLQGGIACAFCSASPFFTWQRRLTRADVAWALLKSSYGPIGAVLEMRVTKRTAGGRAEEITIVGAGRTLALTGYELRRLFGFERIRSPLFDITDVGDAFILDGRGWGHGVGMCQWGAAELARRGAVAPEILAYYYPATELTQLHELKDQPIQVHVTGGS